jgi:hypothetical protein
MTPDDVTVYDHLSVVSDPLLTVYSVVTSLNVALDLPAVT